MERFGPSDEVRRWIAQRNQAALTRTQGEAPPAPLPEART
jgi:hypothetical protein